MSGEPGATEGQNPNPIARQPGSDFSSFSEASKQIQSGGTEPQKNEFPVWTEKEANEFKSRLVDLGIIREGEPQPEKYDLPENALSEEALGTFLKSHGAEKYLESLKDRKPEERHFNMHKLYTLVYSEKARREYEDSIGHSINPPSPTG